MKTLLKIFVVIGLLSLFGWGTNKWGPVKGWVSATAAKTPVLGWIDNLKKTVTKGMKSPTDKPETPEEDPALTALKNQTPEGSVFRMDLPFPQNIEVKEDKKMCLKAVRASQKALSGYRNAELNGTLHYATIYNRVGNQLAITMKTAGYELPPAPVDPKSRDNKPAAPIAPPPPTPAPAPAKGAKPKTDSLPTTELLAFIPSGAKLIGSTARFTRKNNIWKAPHTTDFNVMVWSKDLLPSVPQIAATAGITPKTYWFGNRRLKPGDTVTLSDKDLALLFSPNTTGNVILKLESLDSSNGHPCGVFSTTGNYQEKTVFPDGSKFDRNVTINSGTVWISLIHPVVLREDLDTIQKCTTDANGATMTLQGAIGIVTTREWTITIP